MTWTPAPCLLSLPSVIVYNSLMVWFTNKYYSLGKSRWDWGMWFYMSRDVTGAQSHFFSPVTSLKITDSPCDRCRWEVSSKSIKSFLLVAACHLSSIIMELFCRWFNFGYRVSLRLFWTPSPTTSNFLMMIMYFITTHDFPGNLSLQSNLKTMH